jgi:glycolate oxidase FAD binding subunit
MPAAAPSALETITPGDQAEFVAAVREAVDERTSLFPLGGGTAAGYGLASKAAGKRLSTNGLVHVVDYPARDMTVTVEAGITLAELSRLLAAENQMLPVDIAQADSATLGGAIAVNFSGPRRYGYGTLRDYVIGVSAIDGHGTEFHAGGRVVKNVAGYDFCKLLTGSLGTLAVITQVTLKVLPRPEAAVALALDVPTSEQAEALLAGLVQSRTTPSAIELLIGDAWKDVAGPAIGGFGRLIVGLEGTEPEVRWMVDQLRAEWLAAGAAATNLIDGADAEKLRERLTAFGCEGPPAPWMLKFNTRPSRVVEACSRIRRVFPTASLLSHAGNGIILAKLGDTAAHELAKPLIGELRQAAGAEGGQAIVWNCPTPEELTRQLAWGPARDDGAMMRRLKNQFDPHGLLNPGRFQF